ncbi:MAG: hypothetical protein AAF213_13500 [Pseudomonadota bacterium]
MNNIPYDKLVNVGDVLDRIQASSGQTRPSKGVQMLQRQLSHAIRDDAIPAYNADGPTKIIVHAVREGGSMSVGAPQAADGPRELPEGFVREANVPAAHVLDQAIEAGLYQADRTSRGHQKTLTDALLGAPDLSHAKGSLVLMNEPQSENPLPARFQAPEVVDALPDTIDVSPQNIRRMAAGG